MAPSSCWGCFRGSYSNSSFSPVGGNVVQIREISSFLDEIRYWTNTSEIVADVDSRSTLETTGFATLKGGTEGSTMAPSSRWGCFSESCGHFSLFPVNRNVVEIHAFCSSFAEIGNWTNTSEVFGEMGSRTMLATAGFPTLKGGTNDSTSIILNVTVSTCTNSISVVFRFAGMFCCVSRT